MTTVPERPQLCILCHHTIRPGEPTGEQTLGADSGPHFVGPAHDCCCPTPLAVPCAPCLRALLTGSAEPHACMETTALSINGHLFGVTSDEDCPCKCPVQRAKESEALKTARAQARGLLPPTEAE